MNVDAARILEWLRQEHVGRYPATIARRSGIPRERVDGALTLLIAVGMVRRESNGTVKATS